MIAASYGDAEVAQALLVAGADIASRPPRLRIAAALLRSRAGLSLGRRAYHARMRPI